MLTKLLQRKVLPLLFVALAMSGCDSNYKNQSENAKLPITSCSTTEMGKINVSTLDPQQKTDICNIMVSSIHRLPPVYVLKDFERFVSLVKSTASDDSANSIATQAMIVVKMRRQQNNDDAMQNTFDTLWRIYQNTQTHVTIKDVNAGLRRSGLVASEMSDETLEQFGISLWRNQRHG
ncbi:MAG: hypothetical protein P4M14_10790 [Gammaproteobacteria bacterium]|nr:hypothetical protein [Gammaproteobacteria bacterium]